jgi:predicted phage-related endonuclease
MANNDFHQGYRITVDKPLITIIVIYNEFHYPRTIRTPRPFLLKCTKMTKPGHKPDRMRFISGSDAQIIMGKDEEALLRLWREKRGEEAPADPSSVLIIQLSRATEDLNRRWYEFNSGNHISCIQRRAVHRTISWMTATLDGLVKETGAVFQAEFMLRRSLPEETAADEHMAKLQHNMLVASAKKSVLSIINGGGKWIELWIDADPIYQTNLVAAEKSFWRSVKTGEPPALFDCEPPKSRVEAVRIVNIITP